MLFKENLFFFVLFLAHFQAVVIPIICAFNTYKKFKDIKNSVFIPFGFAFLGLASMFEMIDHTQTDWIYIDHSSFYNWLFYSFLSLGLTFLSISVIKKKLTLGINLFLSFLSIISYLLIDKTVSLVFQILISIFLIINWQRFFKDWVFILYPIFGIILTTFFGTNLSVTDNQIWHIFIGPSGALSVLTFYFVLIRYENKRT